MSEDIPGPENTFVHLATNEYGLFAYRCITGGCALLMTWWVFDLKVETKDMRRDFTAYQLAQEIRVARLEGVISVVDSAIRMQTKNLEVHDNTIQNLWNRIYELNAKTHNMPDFPTPTPRNIK